MTTPILLLGAGRMGGALVKGWLDAAAFSADALMVRDPYPSTDASRAGAVNPADEALSAAKTVVLAVKPQMWREAATTYAALLAPDAVIVARPGKWGNPFSVMEVGRRYPSLTAEQCHSFAVNEFRTDRVAVHPEYPSDAEIRAELAGKDLTCWCKLSEPCHADVLLEIANGPVTP